ncbi:type II toxin-antitoxin system HipA family toxin [Cellulosimicrobium funkei]|nr:type II toxin-antitoxin system HipA family toxin [Cellulosimicrobium funkei]
MTPEIDTLRFVATADVYKAGVLAGHLTRTNSGSVIFTYSEGYDGEPVAFTLPTGQDPIEHPGGGLPAFFSGLLPEGHRLTVLTRATKTSLNDELTLLLAVGADVPGDVQVLPTGAPPQEPAPLATADPGTLDFRTLTDAPDRHALPGVQAKASATMLTTPLATAGRRAILKIDRPEHPHLADNEALHLRAARALKIPVANAEIVRDRNRVSGLLVDRFDRILDPSGAVTRLAMEDAGQMMGVLPAAKYTVDTEALISDVSARTTAPLVAVRNLYLQFVFAWLTGNGDLHAKNISVLRGADGRWAVSPIYDVPSTVFYGDDTMALPVDGKIKKLRLRHWEALAEAIGLPPRAATGARTLALKAAAAIDLSTLPFEGSPLNGALRELRHRRYELEG